MRNEEQKCINIKNQFYGENFMVKLSLFNIKKFILTSIAQFI